MDIVRVGFLSEFRRISGLAESSVLEEMYLLTGLVEKYRVYINRFS